CLYYNIQRRTTQEKGLKIVEKFNYIKQLKWFIKKLSDKVGIIAKKDWSLKSKVEMYSQNRKSAN
ncbi:hypothetical protein ACTGXY_10540, partial [Streptococcus suis]